MNAVATAFLLLAPALFLCATAWCDEPQNGGFRVKLSLQNGHLADAEFGVQDGATNGYDPKLDIMAPPPGIGTGYTAFKMDKPTVFLYRDLRAPAQSTRWQFLARVNTERGPVRISWNKAALPRGYDLFCHPPGKEKPLSMRETNELVIEKSATITFTATQKTQKTADGSNHHEN